MATLKRRERGKPFNQTTIRIATDVYDNILQYARYGESEPTTLSLAIEKLVKRGLNDANIGTTPPYHSSVPAERGVKP